MSLFRRFFVGAGYSLLGAALHRVLLSVAAIVTARVLGVKDYGVYVNLIAVVNLLMTLGLFGMNTAFSTFIPAVTVEGRSAAREVVIAGLVVVGALLAGVLAAAWATASLGAELLYHSALSGAHIRGALPYMAVLTLNTLLLAALYGFQEFRRYSLSMLQLGALVAAGSILGVWRGGLPGLFLGMTLAYGLNTLSVALVLPRMLGEPRATDWAQVRVRARALLAFAFPAFLAGLFIAPAYWIGNLLMVRAGGPALSGFFGVASSLSQLVLFVPLTLAAPLVPMFSEVAAQSDRARFSAFVARNTRMVWCINLPVALLLAAAAPVLIRVLYGYPYAASVPAFVALACSNLLIAVQSVLAYVFIARRRMWEGFTVNAIWFLTVLALMVPLVRKGPAGLALVFLLAYAIGVPVLLLILRRHVDLGPLAVRAGPMLALTLAGFAFAAWTSLSGLPWAAVVALSVAGAAGAALLEWRTILDEGDRALLRDTLARFARREPAAG